MLLLALALALLPSAALKAAASASESPPLLGCGAAACSTAFLCSTSALTAPPAASSFVSSPPATASATAARALVGTPCSARPTVRARASSRAISGYRTSAAERSAPCRAAEMAASQGALKNSAVARASARNCRGDRQGSARVPTLAVAPRRYTYSATAPSRLHRAEARAARKRREGGGAEARAVGWYTARNRGERRPQRGASRAAGCARRRASSSA